MSLRLYDLLPEIYRTYDMRQGRPLEALLQVLQIQYDAVEANIEALYDAWFVETCPPWAVPYIAELLGVRGLEAAAANLPGQRARVGNIQLYRSRKGSLAVLARAAGDAADWPAVAVDSLDGLIVSQALDAPRAGACGSAALRDPETAAWMGTPFSRCARTANVRGGRGGPLAPGWATVSLFRIWAMPVELAVPAAADAPGGYWFAPLGVDTPLYVLPETPTDLFRMPTARETPLPLTRRRLAQQVAACRRGAARRPDPFVIHVREHGVWRRIPLSAVAVMDLSDWTPPPAQIRYGPGPAAVARIEAAVDPETGRFVLVPAVEALAVDYAYGFGLAIGGGPYDRRQRRHAPDPNGWTAVVAGDGPHAASRPAGAYPTLAAALEAWPTDAGPGHIIVADNGAYSWPRTPMEIAADLVIEAANGRHPTILGDLVVEGPGAGARTALALSGLWIGGKVSARGALDLTLTDCTVRPGESPALTLPDGAAQPAPAVHISHSIVGPLMTPVGPEGLELEDSIVDGGAEAPAGLTPATSAGAQLRILAAAAGAAQPVAAARQTRTTTLGARPVLAPIAAPAPRAGARGADRAVDAAAYGQPAYARPLNRRGAPAAASGQPGAYYDVAQAQRLRNIDPVADELLPQGLNLHIDFAD